MKCISTVTPGSDRLEEQREAEDLPRWLAYLTVLAVSLSVPVSLSLNNSSYLRSSTGYSDGGDMYSHIVEALHVKTVLQRGVTDFWFANCTLGYPMFLAYHPLPCLLVGSLMAATERFISPLLLFRWLFVLVLSAMPSTWYAGVRQLGMSQLEASLMSLTLFSVQSWRKFGLEVVAFQQYGIFTQAYGMLLFPVTATKVCDSFKIFLMRIAESPLTGRVYGQKLLGTGGAWDLAFVPYIAARPGVLTYSRGYHDTLSLFYLESIDMNNNTTGFPDLMRLYNIHFLISSRIKFNRQFLKANKLQVHSSCGTTVILARTRTKNIHGYFEFVYTPGIIYGNLKRIRRVVLKTLKLYSINVLFAVNPILKRTDHPIANVYVKSNCSSFFTTTERNFRKCYSEVTEWRINNQMVNEETFLDVVSNSYRSKPSRSHIVQESVSLNEYSAVVEIGGGQTREDIFAAEHLLLKVTYHPYWSCRYKHVTWETRLAADSEGTDTTSEEWSDTAVYLVTPNLMSIVLPAGRYHVVFRYRNPLYQKIGFLMFILGLAVLILLCCLDCLKKLKYRVMKYLRSLR